jgi:DNA-binding PadR family transcriptional regulator
MVSVRRVLGPRGLGPTGRFFGPGELRLALLALIAEVPGHGYALMNRLEARFDGGYQASPGAIYPTLQQLEDEQLVRLETTDERKVYHLTERGRAEAHAHAREVEQLWARAARRGEWAMFRDPDAAEIVGPALRLVKAAVKTVVHAHGDPEMIDRVRMIFDDARSQIERLDRRRNR